MDILPDRLAWYITGPLMGLCVVALYAFANKPLTFHRDVAPIIYTHCAPCHHPGQAAPFDLLNYVDVQKRARHIREVVEQRIMPPWLPDPADGPFVGQRGLTADQITLIQLWVEQGAPEDATPEAPAELTWRDGWQLGTPDLVVQMTLPFDVRILQRIRPRPDLT